MLNPTCFFNVHALKLNNVKKLEQFSSLIVDTHTHTIEASVKMEVLILCTGTVVIILHSCYQTMELLDLLEMYVAHGSHYCEEKKEKE